NVIFNIRPGTYNGQLALDNPVRLSSPTDRVTFQSENGNASSVTISYNTNNTLDPVVRIDADNITFRNVSVTTAGNYGMGFGLYNASSHDSIVGCDITLNTSFNSSYNSAIMGHYSYTTYKGSDITIRKNTATGGYYGIYIS